MSDQTMPMSVRYYERLRICWDGGYSYKSVGELDKDEPVVLLKHHWLSRFYKLRSLHPNLLVWLVAHKRVNWARWMTLGGQFASDVFHWLRRRNAHI